MSWKKKEAGYEGGSASMRRIESMQQLKGQLVGVQKQSRGAGVSKSEQKVELNRIFGLLRAVECMKSGAAWAVHHA